jgi:hypothetical protein
MRQVLRAAASGAAAPLLLGLHAGSRALADTAVAGATRALATARVAAPAALTCVAASMLAAEVGGHEGQCRQKNQTVHEKNLSMESLNRTHHVTTCDRGKPPRMSPSRRAHALRQADIDSAADSVPPHAIQDPDWPDRHGTRCRQIFSTDPKRRRGFQSGPITCRHLPKRIGTG